MTRRRSDLAKPRAQITRILERVEDRFDSVFLDCPPGITLTIDTALRATDTVLVPVSPGAHVTVPLVVM